MALRSPTPTHSFHGAFATTGLPTTANVEVGDTAFNSTLGRLVVCTAVGPVVWSPVGGAGTVSGVTASAPLASSGGATPNVSLTGTVGVANGGTGTTTPPTNGQIPIGSGGSYTPANLTAGTGISVTGGAGTITVANAGVTSVGVTAPITNSGTPTAPTIGLTNPLPTANGGTGTTAPPTNGQILIGSGGSYTPATLTAGSGIVITNAAGSVTVATSTPAVTQVEVDFGALPSWGAEFTLAEPSATATSRVSVWESGATATGRVGNDQAWDQLLLSAASSLGQIVISAIPMPGPVVGRRVICYQIW